MGEHRAGLESRNAGGADELIHALGWERTLLDHLPGGARVTVVHAENVNAEHALHVVFGDVERGFALRDARVCDHGGKGPEGGDGFLYQFFHLGALGDVCDATDGVAAQLFDFGNDLGYKVLVC